MEPFRLDPELIKTKVCIILYAVIFLCNKGIVAPNLIDSSNYMNFLIVLLSSVEGCMKELVTCEDDQL